MYNNKTGRFRITNPQKYLGQKAPFYKSAMEARLMSFCDKNINVKKWAYEPKFLYIPYQTPDGKDHTYIMDFYIEIYENNGSLVKYMVEVKSSAQTGMKNKPKKPKTKSKKAWVNYRNKMKTIMINKSKWKSAKIFAKSKGLQFIIMTENYLGNL